MNRALFLSLAVLLVSFFSATETLLWSSPDEVVAKVLTVDNSRLYTVGTAKLGEQRMTIKVLQGEHRARTVNARNHLAGAMEFDEIYHSGDLVLAALQSSGPTLTARVVAHFRLPILVALFMIFATLLIAYSRTTGIKSLLSFVGSILVIWKVLVPNLLQGGSPVLWCWITLVTLSALIIFTVAGCNRAAIAAFLGTLAGLTIASTASILLGELLHLNGMTQPMAQSLLFETGMSLNMLHILYAAIILGASGAAMDIAMDMAATMLEVQKNHPGISRRNLVRAGFNVGNVVIGTMTTTLLLAYSGGYLTLLMLFLSRDTSLLQILNMKLVAVEITRTVIGSIALVIVAPLTAYISGWLYCTTTGRASLKNRVKTA